MPSVGASTANLFDPCGVFGSEPSFRCNSVKTKKVRPGLKTHFAPFDASESFRVYRHGLKRLLCNFGMWTGRRPKDGTEWRAEWSGRILKAARRVAHLCS